MTFRHTLWTISPTATTTTQTHSTSITHRLGTLRQTPLLKARKELWRTVTLTMAEKQTTATRSLKNDCVIGCVRFTYEDGEGEERSRVHRMSGQQCVVP